MSSLIATTENFEYDQDASQEQVPYTMHRYLEHEPHRDFAATICTMMDSLIEKAIADTTKRLGFDCWTRSLSDYEPSYAFTFPEILYEADDVRKVRDFKEHLVNYIKAIFRVHYLYTNAEWRESGEYEVDAHGSRSRTVHIGSHIYMTFSMRSPHTRRPPLDPVPTHCIWKTGIPYKWETIEDAPDCYNVNYTTRILTNKTF
jgi:hypothetical protein